jgi:hypothetical protein
MTTPDANIEAITIVTGLLAILGRWVYAKATGAKAPDLRQLVDETITSEIADALEDGDTLDTIEDRLTGAVGKIALKIGLKIPDSTVRLAIQMGVLKFRQKVKAREAQQKAARGLPAKADELRALAEKVAAELAKLGPNVAIDTISEAKADGVELLAIGPDGKLGPVQ